MLLRSGRYSPFSPQPLKRQTRQNIFYALATTRSRPDSSSTGSQTSLVLTFCDGVHVFTLDRKAGVFRLAIPNVSIPQDSVEYAIDASNYRHWGDSVRAYVDDCVTGHRRTIGPRPQHALGGFPSRRSIRILAGGGVVLYPADQRPGYVAGRLRLNYEANPISLLIEQAGGAATDTIQRILDSEADRAPRAHALCVWFVRASASDRPVSHRSAVLCGACAVVQSSRFDAALIRVLT